MVSKCSPSWSGIHEKHRSQVAKRYMMVPVNDVIYWNPITFHWVLIKGQSFHLLPCDVLERSWVPERWYGFQRWWGHLCFLPIKQKPVENNRVSNYHNKMTYQDHNIHNLKYQEELENWSSCWKHLNIRHLPLCQRLVQGAHCLESKTSLDLHPKQWIDENIHLENTRIKVTSLHLFCATSADIAVIHPIESCPKEHDIKSQEWTEQKQTD